MTSVSFPAPESENSASGSGAEHRLRGLRRRPKDRRHSSRRRSGVRPISRSADGALPNSVAEFTWGSAGRKTGRFRGFPSKSMSLDG